jgi:tripartite-type tricarboxylate transporter receptor subunit TctC
MKRSILAMFALAAVLAAPAAAQQYPSGPITITTPYSLGGPSGIQAQTLADFISPKLGEPVVAVSKPGGGATIGAAFVASAKPDGLNLLIAGAPSFSIAPTLIKDVPYDGYKAFRQVAMVSNVGNAFAVNAESDIKTVADLVAAARKDPGGITFGTASIGSLGHLATAQLMQSAGVEMTHVPFRGGAPVVADLLAGNIDVGVVNIGPLIPHAEAGTLRILATTGPNRSFQTPDVPTMQEEGFDGFDVQTWYSISGPAGLPDDIVKTLSDAIGEALADPGVQEKWKNAGLEVNYKPFDEADAYVAADSEKMIGLIRAADIKQ